MALTLGAARPTWALPPQPPETWASSGLAGLVLVAVVVAGLAPLALLLGSAVTVPTGVAVVHSLAAAAALGAAATLMLQSAVVADPRLRWVASGYGVVLVLVLLRVLQLHGVDRPTGEQLSAAAAYWLVGQLVLPVAVLSAPLALRSIRLVALPLGGLLALAGLVLAVPAALPSLLTDDGRFRPLLNALWLLVAVVAMTAALLWLRRSPRGWTGPWGWITAGLALGAIVGPLGAVTTARYDAAWWAGLVVEGLALVVPFLGLALHSSPSYWRQARRWRHLETSVRALRVASPLLPGLSVTPEDEEGLPEPNEVAALLRDNRLQTALQPVVRLDGATVVGYEALARFGGRVPTDRWFRGASRAGLGDRLELLTLGSALAQLVKLPDDAFLSVNLSPVALTDPKALALLEAVDLSRIVVEVTEHDAVPDYAEARFRLDRLRSQGARVAVDDTGAGFASLKHVLLLQPDLVKLDISLSRGVEHDGPQRALVRALLRFADEVGMVVIAEGVETREQLEALRALGVPLGQGWHLGVPTLS